MAFEERPEHDSIFRICRHCKLRQDAVEDAWRAIRRQVSEHNDDHLVFGVVAAVSQNVLRSRAPGTKGQTGPARPRSL